MPYITTSVEYGLHCLLWLAQSEVPLSSRDLAELQGISPTFLAKVFAKLEKAGIVDATEGVRGGYLLARKPEDITFLQIVDAIDGRKRLFDCQQIRGRCAVFGGNPPRWATNGVCSIHVVLLQAEKAMRDTLAGETLAGLSEAVARKAPPEFTADLGNWIGCRMKIRTGKPVPSPVSN